MVKVLVDTGLLVAWLDKGGGHARCVVFFAKWEGQLVTTWPVLNEVRHLLQHHIVGLMEKSDDPMMGLADASLVWRAEPASYRQRSHFVRLQVPQANHIKSPTCLDSEGYGQCLCGGNIDQTI